MGKGDNLSLRTGFMMLTGFAIMVLFIMASTSLWQHDFRAMTLFAAIGTALTLLFYRRKLALLALVGCGWIVVNGGLTAVVHPSAVGIFVTLASVVGLIFSVRRLQRQYRSLPPDDWQKMFE